MQMPYASEPFFVYTDSAKIPLPEELEKLVEVKLDK